MASSPGHAEAMSAEVLGRFLRSAAADELFLNLPMAEAALLQSAPRSAQHTLQLAQSRRFCMCTLLVNANAGSLQHNNHP
jgi:hypothetical protein